MVHSIEEEMSADEFALHFDGAMLFVGEGVYYCCHYVAYDMKIYVKLW